MTQEEKRIIVIGGGAAGMLAALTAARMGAPVTLLERNQKVGRKLYITGKGRCNLTNDCAPAEVLANVPRNGKFLTSAVTRFPPAQVKDFFTDLGVPLKTERGNRVFPVSDKAADVVDALFFALRRAGVDLVQDRAGEILTAEGRVTGVKGEKGRYPGRAVVLATGGASYPLTGSTGDGYAMAAALGHTILPPKASLIPLVVEGEECPSMQGLSLRNVAVKVKNQKGKVIFREQGEMLFTHFGVSGPVLLSASSYVASTLKKGPLTLSIDLKPALSEEQLDARILRDFEEAKNKQYKNSLNHLLPAKLVPVILERSGIPAEKKVNEITREERHQLVRAVKDFCITLVGLRDYKEAIITQGGVSVREVNPSTMESKKTAGLYFAGEVLDLDAVTGGFNLQIAWSTGYLAGISIPQ